jgi:hypothetical protein
LGLKAKVTELNDEIARLKVESSEAQDRAKKSRLDAETREGDLHQRLQSSLDALRGEFFDLLPGLIFVPNSSIVDMAVCSFL